MSNQNQGPSFLSQIDLSAFERARSPLAALKTYVDTVLVIDDQLIIVEAVRRMLADEHDIILHSCCDPTQALRIANQCSPTVILQDLVMPDIDGLTLLRFFRANSSTRDVPLIVLSGKEEPLIKDQSFSAGANDYIVKLPSKLELVSRVRYHSSSYIRLLQRNEACAKLAASQEKLQVEHAQAAEYLKSLFPDPIGSGDVKTAWNYRPSIQLGGDGFGYRWIDNDHFAIYLFKTSGHGIGATMHSIRTLDFLCSNSLFNTDFTNPSSVLDSLNKKFYADEHPGKFVSMWYGVYHKQKKKLIWGTAGHPPAVFFSGNSAHQTKLFSLGEKSLQIGNMSDTKFQNFEINLQSFNKLYIFSAGLLEILMPNEAPMNAELAAFLNQTVSCEDHDLDMILSFAQKLNGPGPFKDDISALRILL